MPIDMPAPASLVDLESVLRRRGHLPVKRGDTTQILFPAEKMTDVLLSLGQFEYVKHFSPEPIVPYLNRFAKDSFRKMVRRLLQDNQDWVALGALAEIAGKSTDDYLDFLSRLKILDRSGNEVRLTRPLQNLGPSLEHYVAEICMRELKGAAEWGVTLEGLPRSGGDYDVLAWLDPSLLYVECKSGRLENITESQIREFLQRSVELAPDLAVLLVDAGDNPSNLVVNTVNRVLHEALRINDPSHQPIRLQSDYPGVYFGFHRIYVTNSKPWILTQLRRCLQHYYAHVRGTARWSDTPANFTNTLIRVAECSSQ
jgi:hypothetical protein